VPEWAWWLVAGVTSGATAAALVVGTLLTLDAMGNPYATSEDYGIAAWAAIIAAFYGAIGGFVVAIVSLLVLRLRPVRRRASAGTYAGVAAAVTGVLTTLAITPFLGVAGVSPYSSLASWVWWALPIVGTSATSAVVGAALWNWTGTRSGRSGTAV
jgi:hypothetical protein